MNTCRQCGKKLHAHFLCGLCYGKLLRKDRIAEQYAQEEE